jgi:hypothetical protein
LNVKLRCQKVKWFSANQLLLNLDKTNRTKFITNNLSYSVLRIGNNEEYIEEMVKTKFLGLQIDNHLNWKSHTEPMIPRLSKGFYAVTSMVHISSINTLKSVYYEYFHSVIKYRILIGCNSSNSLMLASLCNSNKLTNWMQQFYRFITWRLCVAQHFSGASLPINRNFQLH